MSARRLAQAFAVLALASVAIGGCASRTVASAPRAATTSPSPRPISDGPSGSTEVAPTGECEEAPDVESANPADGPAFDDGMEAPVSDGAASSSPLPFADLSSAELDARLRKDIAALGSMSIGSAHGGVLVAGVQMPAGTSWELVSPTLSWGTRETVDALVHGFDSVAARFPDGPKAFVGNISAKSGGHLAPHVSHQSGRDADIGYYLREGHRWYATANAVNLDRARTWHLVRTFIAESDVDLILIDTSIQRVLKAYALEIGEDPAWLDQVFQVGGKSSRPIIFHAKGHATHLHVRFYAPAARELGRRAYRTLLARRLIAPPTVFVSHTAKSGDSLSRLAVRYKVTADVIKKANGMRDDKLRVNTAYKIPQTGGIPAPERFTLPARRVPPPPNAVAANTRLHKNGEPCLRAATRAPERPGS
jgi:murein endopeptidase